MKNCCSYSVFNALPCTVNSAHTAVNCSWCYVNCKFVNCTETKFHLAVMGYGVIIILNYI